MAWVLQQKKTMPNTAYQIEYWTQDQGMLNTYQRQIDVEVGVRKNSGSGYWSNNSSKMTYALGGGSYEGTKASYDFRNYAYLAYGSQSKRTQDYNASGTRSSTYSTSYTGDLGATSLSGSYNQPAVDVKSAITSVPNFNPNDGITVNWNKKYPTSYTRIEVYNDTNVTSLAVSGVYSGNMGANTTKYVFSDGQKTVLYNYLNSASGRTVYVRLVTYKDSTGSWATAGVGAVNTTTKVVPKAFGTTVPASAALNSTFTVTAALMHSNLYNHGGVAYNGSWMTSFPKSNSKGSANLSVPLTDNAFKKQVLGLMGGSTSLATQVYVRQYNENGNELGLVIKNMNITLPTFSTSATVTPQVVRILITHATSGNVTSVIERAYRYKRTADSSWGAWVFPNTTSMTITGLAENTSYDVQVAAKQDGATVYVYSGTYTVKTLSANNVSVTPTTVDDDGTITITRTKVSGVDGELIIRRLADNYDILRETLAGGARTFTFKPEDFGTLFSTNSSLTVRVLASSTVGGTWQINKQVDIKVEEGGVIWLRHDGAWKKAKMNIRVDGAWKTASLSLRESNTWKRGKS